MVASGIFLLLVRPKGQFPLQSFLLAGIACAALLGGVLRGLTISMVSEAMVWFLASFFAFMCSQMSCGERDVAKRAICWFGIACSVLGILVYADWLPIEGAMNAGRLQFTFQYANTAGLWFSVVAILAFTSRDARLFKLGFLPLVALLFTQSGGAIVLFGIVSLIMLKVWLREDKDLRLAGFLIQAIISLAVAALCVIMPNTIAVIVVMIGVVASMGMQKKLRKVYRVEKHRRFIPLGIGLVMALCCCVAMLLSGRLLQASQTIVERLIQVYDAAHLLTMDPLLGVGPDAWRYLYPYIQSAQYHAASVHCGYMQIALDAGLVGLALFLVMLVLGLVRLFRQKDYGSFLVVGLIACHGLIDFDFQFASILLLLVFLVSDSSGICLSTNVSLPIMLTFGLLAAVACCVGTWSGMVKSNMLAAGMVGDVESIEQEVMLSDLVARDVEVETALLMALLHEQEWKAVVQIVDEDGIKTDEQALIAGESFYSLDRSADAERIIIEELKRQPYNTQLFSNAKKVFEKYGLSEEMHEEYCRVVNHANKLIAQGGAALLSNQKEVDAY